MKVGIANDHAGYPLRKCIIAYLKTQNIEIIDFGTNSPEPVDYPDYGHPLAIAVENREVDFGIAMCGTGNGINMVTNKHQGVRSALCWNDTIATLTRSHNNANIVALPGRFVTDEMAVSIVKKFLHTSFEGGRHIPRIQKIPIQPHS